MKMTTRVAYCNMRHYKSKNILIGIAIILTTLLLFVIPSIGKDMVEVNFAVINKIYPTWHALYRNVDESTVMKLAAHHDVKTYGLRSDAGYMNLEDATVSMMYMDRTGMELYKVKLKEGQLPQKENDIVVSKGILEALGQNGKIGDTITVPYQILKDDGLDYTKEKDFRICGFLADNESSKEQKQYTSLVSEAFLKAEIPVEQVKYRFLLQVNGQKGNTTADYTETIQNIARQFGISEDDMNINKEYLAANYVDPATIPVIVGIMLIVVLAGIITIYSVYYVSMNQRVREFVERFPELSLFYRLSSPLDSEMICIFPYFCPCEESAREIREILCQSMQGKLPVASSLYLSIARYFIKKSCGIPFSFSC